MQWWHGGRGTSANITLSPEHELLPTTRLAAEVIDLAHITGQHFPIFDAQHDTISQVLVTLWHELERVPIEDVTKSRKRGEM